MSYIIRANEPNLTSRTKLFENFKRTELELNKKNCIKLKPNFELNQILLSRVELRQVRLDSSATLIMFVNPSLMMTCLLWNNLSKLSSENFTYRTISKLWIVFFNKILILIKSKNLNICCFQIIINQTNYVYIFQWHQKYNKKI